jgi:hypothetical protein
MELIIVGLIVISAITNWAILILVAGLVRKIKK